MRTAPQPRVRRVTGSGARAVARFGMRTSQGSRVRRLILAGLVAVAVAASVYLVLPRSQPTRYGGLPSWLPTPTVSVGRVVQASAAHPWLAIEGDSVRVQLARGQVLATAVGPQVPEAGQFPVPATTPCAFTITFVNASGVVPLSQAAFTILDEQGNLHRPLVTVAGGGALPADIPPGQKVILIVKDVLPTGAGALRWSPDDAKPIVSWDFDVEID